MAKELQQWVYQVVVGLVRRENEILLVKQQEPYEKRPTWVLPGGGVESTEMLHEALVREMREETGLRIMNPGRLVYVVQVDNPLEHHQLIVYVFELHDWQGQPASADPDGYVTQASFLPLPEALDLLERDHFRPRCEPAIAYLKGEYAPGALWLYRRRDGKKDELIWRPDGF